jgi:hypothetical protein
MRENSFAQPLPTFGLLILDEPSEGLDPVMAEQMLQNLVRQAADGTTIFFSSHQVAEVEHIAGHIIAIEKGRVILQGSLDQLRQSFRRVNRWFFYRSLNGAVQSMAAALIPALAVPITAAVFGGDYPVGDAFLLGLRLGLGGMQFYSIGLLASTLFSGDFTSAGIGIALVFTINNSTRVIESLKGLNLQDEITPMYAIDRSTSLIRGQMPWNGIVFSFALTFILSVCAWKVTVARYF